MPSARKPVPHLVEVLAKDRAQSLDLLLSLLPISTHPLTLLSAQCVRPLNQTSPPTLPCAMRDPRVDEDEGEQEEEQESFSMEGLDLQKPF
eukprot:756752-Hanusia_phi.AAC.4